jgi:hypothetical protein
VNYSAAETIKRYLCRRKGICIYFHEFYLLYSLQVGRMNKMTIIMTVTALVLGSLHLASGQRDEKTFFNKDCG